MRPILQTCIVAPLLACLLAGCGEGNEPASRQTPATAMSESFTASDAYLAFLKKKAIKLGETELARLAATEMIYRNDVQHSTTVEPVFGKKTGAYARIYRNFHSFEVEDIVRADSLLFPIVFDIRFKYDLLSTPIRQQHLPNAAETAASDRGFKVLKRLELVRSYPCDDEGELSEHDFQPLPRPNLFSRDTNLQGPSSSPLTVRRGVSPPITVVDAPMPGSFPKAMPLGQQMPFEMPKH